VPGTEYWSECLRIMVPGGNIIAMGGTRTFHRLACAIEDAGYEIRDCISYLYGSGFPKSHNFGCKCQDPQNSGMATCEKCGGLKDYKGFGTALKPAWEPCIVAMKPIDGTFKQNAEKWGQAGINIDGCRVEGNKPSVPQPIFDSPTGSIYEMRTGIGRNGQMSDNSKGRWPANVLFDEEAAKMLDEQSGKLAKSSIREWNNSYSANNVLDHGLKPIKIEGGINDTGGASRFFYCAKASSRERNEGLENLLFSEGGIKNDSGCGFSETDPMKPIQYKNNHPTVKPLKLMEYLIKLVMPPKDGILLDPFAGSGTTILAAKRLGFSAIGIEKQEDYLKIAQARLDHEN